MTAASLELLCRYCRHPWPPDVTMGVVAAHYEIEHDHTGDDLPMDMAAVCGQCRVEMTLERTEPRRAGGLLHHYQCPVCRRSARFRQEAQPQ